MPVTIEASSAAVAAVAPVAPAIPDPAGSSEARYLQWAKRIVSAANLTPSAMFPVNGLTFGVEVECFIPSRWCNDNAITRGGYSNAAQIYGGGFPDYSWKCGTDGSLDGGPSGSYALEFKTIPLAGPKGLDALIKGLRVLGRSGARGSVNASCGLHIHVGIPDTTQLDIVRRIVALSARFERVLFATTGSVSRESDSSYCVPIRDKVKPMLDRRGWNRRDLVMAQQGLQYDEDGHPASRGRGYFGESRYSSVNFQPLLDGRGTVEFRLFAGTLNVKKIIGHLACSLAIVQKAISNERSISPDGWTPDTNTPAASAAALMEAWRSFQVSMGWIGSNRPVFGWIDAMEETSAPSLLSCRKMLTSRVKKYALAKFGTTGADADNEDVDGEGE